MEIELIFLGDFLMHDQSYARKGVVKFQVDRRLFGARNDRLQKGLGVEKGVRDLFVIISEKTRA